MFYFLTYLGGGDGLLGAALQRLFAGPARAAGQRPDATGRACRGVRPHAGGAAARTDPDLCQGLPGSGGRDRGADLCARDRWWLGGEPVARDAPRAGRCAGARQLDASGGVRADRPAGPGGAGRDGADLQHGCRNGRCGRSVRSGSCAGRAHRQACTGVGARRGAQVPGRVVEVAAKNSVRAVLHGDHPRF